jgi:hypothetical protein
MIGLRQRPRVQQQQSPPRRRFWRRHRILTGIGLVVVLLLAVAAPSLISALTRAGTDSVAERLTEWARTHGMSSMVDFAERVQYDLNQPKTGGTPAGGVPREPGAKVSRSLLRRAGTTGPVGLHVPGRLPSFAKAPLPHEGVWRVVDTVHGEPAVATAFLRPDTVHTSYLSGLVWMNPRLLRFSLHPGTEDPGSGSWGQSDNIPASSRHGLLAAFNSGFRLYAARGGYYSYGHTAVALQHGSASLVIYRNGSATVGAWGRDVHMTPQVAAVRQNLALIVDHGSPVAGLQQNVQQQWGATLGNAYFVWRSGIGVRPDGSLVYVAGGSLSVQTLARLLARAGCVRAMELDINPEWTQFVLYSGNGQVSNPVPRNLLSDMQQPADRYYSPSSRDFFVVHARGAG